MVKSDADIILELREIIAKLEAKNEKLRKTLRNIIDMGHNEVCLLCAQKDFHAKQKLEEK